jgi:ribosomal protein S4E
MYSSGLLADVGLNMFIAKLYQIKSYCYTYHMNALLKDGDQCKVVAGTHKGKSGTVKDIHESKTGAITITIVQENGERFKTLAKNVVIVR